MKPLDARRWDALKADHVLRAYERIFADLAAMPGVALLELGVHRGGSLAMWKDYFERSTIVGLDMRDPSKPVAEGVTFYRGSQSDTALLTKIAGDTAPAGFDIIIDDCSHIGEWSRVSFWHLFEHHLKPGGIYVLEDWGTGFLPDWPDGRALPRDFRHRRSVRGAGRAVLERVMRTRTAQRYIRTHWRWKGWATPLFARQRFRSHSYGMVGFVKQLLDEFGVVQTPVAGTTWIERMEILPSQVFVFKKQTLP